MISRVQLLIYQRVTLQSSWQNNIAPSSLRLQFPLLDRSSFANIPKGSMHGRGAMAMGQLTLEPLKYVYTWCIIISYFGIVLFVVYFIWSDSLTYIYMIYIYMYGWWLQPLWKICSSIGMIIPNILKVIKFMFQTTNQIYDIYDIYIYSKLFERTSWFFWISRSQKISS